MTEYDISEQAYKKGYNDAEKKYIAEIKKLREQIEWLEAKFKKIEEH